jgi:hypothetical protein
MRSTRFRRRFIATISLFSWLTAISSGAASIVTIATAGRSDYRIVVSNNAIPSERYAAEELQRYLGKITGAKLPIVTDSTRPSSREICLGDNGHLRKLGLSPDFDRLGPDGFLIRTHGNQLTIAGGKPRGTLYGVYSLLEKQLGVRWFTPEVESVLKTNRLVLPPINETQVPALEYREVFWTEMMRNADFAARHRLNGNHYQLTEKHGGRAASYFPFVHSFDSLIPPELFKEHPDYFPLINGKRANGYVQRCLSNPDVLSLAKTTVRKWIHEHPEATIISVSQNDTGNWCQCDKCKALDDAEGTPAASMIQFVNNIAEDIEHDFPKVRIDTLAYQYTRKPPRTLRPRSNVIVRLCSIECCFAHPLATCDSEANRRFRDDIIAWEPVAPLLYVWDYTPNFGHYQQPFPNLEALQPNVRFFVAHNVRGLFEQGNYSVGGNGELGPLRAYLLAKLLWEPGCDLRKHTDEFLGGYYGHAAATIRAYLELLEGQVRDGKTHAHIYDSPRAAYLNEAFLQAADRLLSEAEESAESEVIKFRVRVARLPIWYAMLARSRVSGEARTELLQRFLEGARKAGISNISEAQSLEEWGKKQAGK